jgi:ribonuclease-3
VTDLDEPTRTVQRMLGHAFHDPRLLLDALTHRSFAHERPEMARTNNERLEYLGDAVLQWAVSSVLFERYPGASAGELTRRRADLVCEDGLALIARELGIGPALRLGRGEERSGGRDKPRLLSSALEACIAAVHEDGGDEAARTVCVALFAPRMHEAAPGARDFKTRLQETLQRKARGLPSYELLSTSGPDHARGFEVAVRAGGGEELARGQGKSKLEAEQAAAERALQALEAETPAPVT